MNKVILFICLLFSISLSANQIYKCKLNNGQTTFSDKPCSSSGSREFLSFPSSKGSPLSEPVTRQETKLNYNDFKWFEDVKGCHAALKESKKYQTPILMYFQADWCPYCRQLDRELLETSSAKMVTRQYVKVRITPDHGADERALFNKLGGTGYPTLMIQNNPDTKPGRLSAMTKRGNQWKVMSASDFEKKLSKYFY